jgi:hypothetical protein
MSGDEDDRVESIARTIACYLAANPGAADTVDGIRRWWLTPAQVDAPIERIRAALEQLRSAGYVAARRMPDGRVVFSAGTARHGVGGRPCDRDSN